MLIKRRTRREFVRDGLSAVAMGWAAPGFLTDLARAQTANSRNLVVLYLGGGNDALSFLVPYTDPAYYERRPTLAIPFDRVIDIGADTSGQPLGLHPELDGFKRIFDDPGSTFFNLCRFWGPPKSTLISQKP